MTEYKNRFSTRSNKRTPKSLQDPVLPLPEFTEAQAMRMDALLELLSTFHERKYSELSINERRLVEMCCKRVYIKYDLSGKELNESNFDNTVLVMGPYFHVFAVSVLGRFFQRPKASDFHIIEDEPMRFEDLYGNPYQYSGDPYQDAFNSYPNNYLPVRASAGKAYIKALWTGSKGEGVRSDPSKFIYKNRASAIPNEAKYLNPFLGYIEEKVEEAKPVVKSSLENYLLAIEIDIATPLGAAVYDAYLQDPAKFVSRFGELPEPSQGFLNTLETANRSSEAYAAEFAKFA